jgi:hypothetical protein
MLQIDRAPFTGPGAFDGGSITRRSSSSSLVVQTQHLVPSFNVGNENVGLRFKIVDRVDRRQDLTLTIVIRLAWQTHQLSAMTTPFMMRALAP